MSIKTNRYISIAVFCRNAEFNFIGRCIVSLNNAEDARRLIEYGHRRVLGGNTLKVNYVSFVCVQWKEFRLKVLYVYIYRLETINLMLIQ